MVVTDEQVDPYFGSPVPPRDRPLPTPPDRIVSPFGVEVGVARGGLTGRRAPERTEDSSGVETEYGPSEIEGHSGRTGYLTRVRIQCRTGVPRHTEVVSPGLASVGREWVRDREVGESRGWRGGGYRTGPNPHPRSTSDPNPHLSIVCTEVPGLRRTRSRKSPRVLRTVPWSEAPLLDP